MSRIKMDINIIKEVSKNPSKYFDKQGVEVNKSITLIPDIYKKAIYVVLITAMKVNLKGMVEELNRKAHISYNDNGNDTCHKGILYITYLKNVIKANFIYCRL